MNHCYVSPRKILFRIFFAVSLLAIAGISPASAQFMCTSTATDVTCTNSGTAASENNFDLSKNVTTNNSGTVTTSIVTTTGNTGNATTTNSGSVGTDITTTAATSGDASTTNHGSVGGSIFTFAFSGNATGFNDGAIGGNFSTTNEGSGVASAINHGSVGDAFSVTSVFSSAALTNYGTANSLSTDAPNGGTATTINMGSVTTSIMTQAVNGNATTINSGSVGTSVTNFSANTGIATVINSGSIGTTLQNTAVGGNAVTTNSGSVGGNMTTLADFNGDATVTNSGFVGGVIDTTAVFQNATVTNYGSAGGITISAPVSGSATVINAGTVSGIVQLSGFNAQTLINSGLISNPGGTAVQFNGAGATTLSLLPGSFIVGAINLNAAAANTVNVGAGNLNMNFNTLAGATITGTVPFAVSGNQVATIDPTPFGMTDRNLMDFTSGVSSAIPTAEGQDGSVARALPFSERTDANSHITDAFDSIPGLSSYASRRPMLANASASYSNGWSIWTRGFAGQRDQPADGASLHTLSQYFGGMFGWDMQARSDLRLGVFAGGGETRSSVDQNYGDTKSNIAFAGIYANYSPGVIFLHAALQGGHSLNDSTRNINNNLAPGGWETAKASYGSTYFSPEATVGTRFGLGSLHGAFYALTPSLKLRYLFASYDGYTETGSTANLSVGPRIVQDFEERAQLKLTGTRSIAANKTVTGSLYAGVLGIQRAGDTTVDAMLLGQSTPFAVPGNSSVQGAFGGAGMEFRTGATTFFADAEYLRLSDSSYVMSGRGGIKLAF
jgi:hypothetical protein